MIRLEIAKIRNRHTFRIRNSAHLVARLIRARALSPETRADLPAEQSFRVRGGAGHGERDHAATERKGHIQEPEGTLWVSLGVCCN